MSTDVTEFFQDLDGGVFAEKLSHILSDVGAAVIDHGAGGDVTIKLKMKRIATSHQVEIEHTLDFTRPTTRGKASETESTKTPMYVGERGRLTFFPEKQGQMFDKRGQINSEEK